MEKQVGVSFIRAEVAIEAMVVSMDSSSMSSVSKESTRETSFVTSATILKETSLMGVGALASFVGVHALGSFEGVGTCRGMPYAPITIKAEAIPQGRQPCLLIFMKLLYKVS